MMEERIHVDEFVASQNLTDMEKAGFMSKAGNKVWMFLHEWEGKLQEYRNGQ